MAKVPKMLKKLVKDLDKEKHWLASEYKYLTEVKEDLQHLVNDLSNFKKEKRDSMEARRDFRQVGRSERRVSRFDQRRLGKVKELMEILPDKLKDIFNRIETDINLAKSHLARGASLFTGELREETDRLRTTVGILSKQLSQRTVNMEDAKRTQALIATQANTLILKLSEIIKWVGSLSVDIKAESEEVEKLRRVAG